MGWRAILMVLSAFPILLKSELLPIRTYTAADGLAANHVDCIVRDSRGFIWFCTPEGLSRFDGYKFTNYGIEQGLPGRQVNDFLEDRSGIYFVATDKGSCRFVTDPLPQVAGAQGATQKFAVYYPGEEA